jgi:hypothetical protein
MRLYESPSKATDRKWTHCRKLNENDRIWIKRHDLSISLHLQVTMTSQISEIKKIDIFV